MDNCNDHWCDFYGKGSDKCDRCEKKNTEQDKTDLLTILKRRDYHLTGVDRVVTTKSISQKR